MCLTILLQYVPFLLILGMFVPDIAAEGLIFVEVRYINATMSNILKVRNVNDYARYLGGGEQHPLVSVIDYAEVSPVRHCLCNYSVYGLFLRDDADVDLDYLSSEFGTRFIHIGIDELIGEYASVCGGAPEGTPSEEERIRAAENMEMALRNIVARHGLTALTVKCFDLLPSCRTTSCLALARLNDEGIICGCEGDIPSLWTMMTVYAHCGRAPFMANPSSSDRSRLSVDFAHCTVPTSMASSFTLPTHFESGIGVGVAGILPTGRYSIVKIGGRKLDRIFWAKGSVTANTCIAARCRTQVSFRFDNSEDFDRFFANRLGNHVILTAAL